ncbi:LPXTG cell wall anchor domain-containing protein, partial [Ruminococcus sp.]|uniref:LPXTG cell wall anchor domain-containing protein n=1 Tax=Ruminococcus sp. TaxID=41978 RepID=UPI003F7EC10E
WEVDKIGDGENPDGIPDKYQKKVTFKVVNGTWEDKTNKDISFYVTLLDDNGKWSVNGSARINIPTGMIANYGYENGKWDIEPTQTVSGTDEVIYVYSFEKIAETKPQPTTSQPTPTVKTVVQEKTVYKTQYVEPITLKTGENLTFLGVLSGLCALGFAGTIIFAKKRSK